MRQRIEAGTVEAVEDACKRAAAWESRLLEAAAQFGSHRAALFKPISPMDEDETRALLALKYLSWDHFDYLRTHWVQMYRLRKLLEELPLRQPRGTPGRKEIDDNEVVAETLQIIAEQKKPNKSAAVDEAIDELYPSLDDDERERMRNRILRSKLRKNILPY